MPTLDTVSLNVTRHLLGAIYRVHLGGVDTAKDKMDKAPDLKTDHLRRKMDPSQLPQL